MSGLYQLTSYSPNFSGYAPADFLDATETQPPEIALDPTSTGSFTPYNTLVANISNRQLQEVKEKTVTGISSGQAWRKRIKEFMLHKNEDLLEFARKPLSSHPTMSQADAFLRRFGITNFSPTHHSLREIYLDSSGVSLVGEIEQELLQIGPASSVKLVEEVRWIYDAYRLAGEETMKSERLLKSKVDSFDKIHQKVTGLMSLPTNDKSDAFYQATMDYLESIFKDQEIEKEYKSYIESYRRFIALKEMIMTFRFTDNMEKEPLCSICLNEPVGYCLNPCGHTFCTSCVKRQLSNCYMCRTVIKDRIRIFFG